MKKRINILALMVLLGSIALVIASCDEEGGQSGCTDPSALNYDPLAIYEDSSCEYLSKTQTIWNNGKSGFWEDDTITGTIYISPCFRSYDTASIAGKTSLLLMKDTAGYFGMLVSITNRKNAIDYFDGNLKFDVMLPTSSSVTLFDVFIHGNVRVKDECNYDLYMSDPISLSTSSFSSSAFTTVTLPLANFGSSYLGSIYNVFGINQYVAGGGDTALIINNIKWTTDK